MENDQEQQNGAEINVERGDAPALTREQLVALMQMLGIDPEGEEDSDGDSQGDDEEAEDDADVSPDGMSKKQKEKLDEQMYQAVRAGDKEAFLQALEKGANLRYQHHCPTKKKFFGGQQKIKTALHVAASKGHAELAKLILAKDPDTVKDVSPFMGRNALHYACNRKSNVEVLKVLIEEGGMNVNEDSSIGWTPFHFAIDSIRLDLAKYLASVGANIHKEVNTGINAVMLAACSRGYEVVRWLLDQGITPNVQDSHGSTPLHRLGRFGDLTMVKLLVEHGGADVTLLDNSGCSVMEEADRHNMSDIATYVWTKGCETSSLKNPDGMGPIAWFRVRHINLPSSRYGTGLAHLGSKLVVFSGFGQGIDHVNHDNENRRADTNRPSALIDTHIADLNEVTHASIIPLGVNPGRPEITLNPQKCGDYIRLDADNLKMWSVPGKEGERVDDCLVMATHPFKRSEKFGYYEVHVANAGEDRILTIGLVDAKFEINQKQPGWVNDSYGYHGDDGSCFHNSGSGKTWAERFDPGDVIGCGINFEGNGEVFWTKNGKFLGVSNIGPQADEYYPAIGVANNGAIATVNFGKVPFQFSFQVPTLTWKMVKQEKFACSSPKLLPLNSTELLAIPDVRFSVPRVWIFNMNTLKWRAQACAGVNPMILSESQVVRLGGSVYVWNTHSASNSEYSRQKHAPTLFRLDLEYWAWSELSTYDIKTDRSVDKNLQVVVSEDDDDAGTDWIDLGGENPPVPRQELNERNFFKSYKAADRNAAKKAALKYLPQLPANELSELMEVTTSDPSKPGSSEASDKPKLTPKEVMANRIYNFVALLLGDFKDSFFVAMEDELIFVAHKSMLKVDLKSYDFSVTELQGTRPLITYHSSVAVGTDIVTFGGFDDRKQQNELFVLDTRAKLWYKPHIGGLIFPRQRNNHSCIYFETSNPTFAMDPNEDAESSILAKHASSYFSYDVAATEAKKRSTSAPLAKTSRSAASSSISAATDSATATAANTTSDEGVYRFCVMAMGWNGINSMIDIDFLALDTQKRVEELGTMLDTTAGSVGSVDFDVKIDVFPASSSPGEASSGSSIASLNAHKAILWARSDYFKALLTEELVSETSNTSPTTFRMEGSVEHIHALLRFLYTDHVNVISLMSDYRNFVKLAEKYAPNHVSRLVAEYLHTKVYEPELLNKDLGELLASGAFADVKFVVGGQTFKAHKVVLSARSSFFKAMLTGGLKESRQTEITLDYCTAEEFGALLQFLYTRNLDYAHISEYILGLFALSNRCDAKRLKSILESLIAFNLDATNVASLLLLADQHASPTLKQSCISFIRLNTEDVHYEDSAQKQQVDQIVGQLE